MSLKSLINAVVVCLLVIGAVFAQATSHRNYSRADFVNIEGGSLSDRIARATRQFRDSKAGDTVWLAYHFPANEEISIGPFSGTIYRDEDGIRLVRRDDPQGTSIVLLVETSSAQPVIRRIRTLNLSEPYVFEDRPVYWLGNIDANESVGYLESAMRSQPAEKDIVRGALRAIGSHQGSRVVPLLREVAQKDATEEFQRAAISNLGRVGSAESIEALIGLYESSTVDVLKEEVISALGRQKERRAADKLLSIAKNDTNPKLRQAAIRRLSNRSAPFAVDFR